MFGILELQFLDHKVLNMKQRVFEVDLDLTIASIIVIWSECSKYN